MIVDIYIPSVDKTYDFKLDENQEIAIIIEEIVEMISQKENCTISGNVKDLLLVRLEDSKIFDKNRTLSNYKICNGKRLILV